MLIPYVRQEFFLTERLIKNCQEKLLTAPIIIIKISFIIETNLLDFEAKSSDKIVLTGNKEAMLRDIRAKLSNKRAKSGKKGANSVNKWKKLHNNGEKLTKKRAKITKKGAKITEIGAKRVIKVQNLSDFEVFGKIEVF